MEVVDRSEAVLSNAIDLSRCPMVTQNFNRSLSHDMGMLSCDAKIRLFKLSIDAMKELPTLSLIIAVVPIIPCTKDNQIDFVCTWLALTVGKIPCYQIRGELKLNQSWRCAIGRYVCHLEGQLAVLRKGSRRGSFSKAMQQRQQNARKNEKEHFDLSLRSLIFFFHLLLGGILNLRLLLGDFLLIVGSSMIVSSLRAMVDIRGDCAPAIIFLLNCLKGSHDVHSKIYKIVLVLLVDGPNLKLWDECGFLLSSVESHPDSTVAWLIDCFRLKERRVTASGGTTIMFHENQERKLTEKWDEHTKEARDEFRFYTHWPWCDNRFGAAFQACRALPPTKMSHMKIMRIKINITRSYDCIYDQSLK